MPLLAIGLAFAPAYARGQDARTEFQRGQTAYDAGRYEDAIEAWTRAYELDPRPLLKYNLAQAFERLGRLELAVAALETYIRDAPPDDPRITAAHARLAAIQGRLRETGVHLLGGPEGAIVRIDGVDVGRLPRPDPFPVSPGSHEVSVEHRGRRFDTVVAVPAGQRVEVRVRLDGTATSGGGGEGAATAGWVIAGVGAAMVVASVVTGVVALDLHGSLTARCPQQMCPPGVEYESDRSLGEALSITTDVLLFGGLALAASGVVMGIALGSESSSVDTRAALTCGPTGCVGMVGGSF